MKIIKLLTDLIDEELCDAEKYAKLALEHKESDAEVAQMFFQLSQEELKHMATLHTADVNIVKKHMNDTDPRTEGMKIAHEILHERAMEKEKEVRILLDMYRGS